LFALLAACGASNVPAQTYLKGQLHAHSGSSGDSHTPPADVARWYAAHGFDFVVFTDHNHVTHAPSSGAMLSLPGVELTQNFERCAPDNGEHCLAHVNALLVDAGEEDVAIPHDDQPERRALYLAAAELAARLGGVAQLNHPNFMHTAADPELIASLAEHGIVLMEIANMSGVANEGDAAHLSSEALWDAVLTRGATIWGTATDDAHHYDDADAVRARGETAYTGDRGWVMVHAEKNLASIRAALARGDFYASTGVTLRAVRRTADALELDVAEASPGTHRFEFIGLGGKVLERAEGRRARFELSKAAHGYVRAVVTAPDGRKAWTQPIRMP
jgi:hypothetical protein